MFISTILSTYRVKGVLPTNKLPAIGVKTPVQLVF